MAKVGSLVIDLEAGTARFESDFKKATAALNSNTAQMRRSLNALSARFKQVQVASLQLAAAAGVAFSAGNAINAAQEFNQKLRDISTITDMTKGQLRDLGREILDLSRAVQIGASDLGAAQYQILSAGITDSATAFQALSDAAKLGKAGLATTEEAADLVTSAMNAFGVTSKEAADVIFKTVQDGKTTVAQLAQSFGNVAAIMPAVGVSFKEMQAATAALTLSGQTASVAQNNLKAAISNILTPTADAAKEMKRLNAENKNVTLEFSASALQTKGLTRFLDELKKATGGNADSLKKLFGSVEAYNAILSLTGAQAKDYARILNDLNKSNGAVEEGFKKQLNSLDRLKISFDAFLITTGQAFLDFLGESTGAMDGLAISFDRTSDAIPKVAKFLNGMGETAVQMTQLVLGSIGYLFNGVILAITKAVGLGLQGIENLTNGTMSLINNLFDAIEQTTRFRFGRLDTDFRLRKKNVADMAGKQAWENLNMFGVSNASVFGDLMEGRSSAPVPFRPMIRQADINSQRAAEAKRQALMKSSLVSGRGGGGHHAETPAEKELREQTQAAQALTQAMRTPFEVAAAKLAEYDKLLAKHRITKETYKRAVNDLAFSLNNEATAFKAAIKSLTAPDFENFMAPHKKWLDGAKTDLSDALNDTAFQEIQRIIQDTRTPIEQHLQRMEYLNWLNKEGKLSTEDWMRAAKKSYEELDATHKATSQSATQLATAIGNVTAQFGDKFFNTMVEGMKAGKLAFRDFVSSALEDLAKLIFKLMVTIPLANALSMALTGQKASAGSSALSSLVTSGISGLFGALTGGVGHAKPLGPVVGINGALADGGSFTPGNYWVGEEGPEVVHLGGSGTVTPNHMLGGNTQIINQITVQGDIDARVQASVARMMPQITQASLAALQADIRRGGPTAALVGQRH